MFMKLALGLTTALALCLPAASETLRLSHNTGDTTTW